MRNQNSKPENDDFIPDPIAHKILSIGAQIISAVLIGLAVVVAYLALAENAKAANTIAYIAAALGVFNLLNTSAIAYLERRMKPHHSAGRLKKLEGDYERLKERLEQLEKRSK